MKKQTRKNSSYILSEWLVTGLMLISILLMTYPLWKERVISYQIATQPLVNYSMELPKKIPNEEMIHSLSLTDSLQQVLPKELTMYGSIQIPEINWIQPLYIGITNQNLFYGGVVMFPKRSLATDNLVVFGHHLGLESLLFGQLVTKAQVGQEIKVMYLDEERTYKISETVLIDERDLDVLAPSAEPMLTIFTCPTPVLTSQRYLIRAYPIAKEKAVTTTAYEMQRKEVRIYQHKQTGNLKIMYIVILIVIICIFLLNRTLFKYYLK
ncbi:class A sortase [uncultured Enterococcus sp.]|uniref:class A sortase n=1 Tax=uncultured Enterococcus sp. TaxID=167972 RepID=UPI0025E51FA7|nr:class A sortase [uncultured Enterococcus sp.]